MTARPASYQPAARCLLICKGQPCLPCQGSSHAGLLACWLVDAPVLHAKRSCTWSRRCTRGQASALPPHSAAPSSPCPPCGARPVLTGARCCATPGTLSSGPALCAGELGQLLSSCCAALGTACCCCCCCMPHFVTMAVCAWWFHLCSRCSSRGVLSSPGLLCLSATTNAQVP